MTTATAPRTASQPAADARLYIDALITEFDRLSSNAAALRETLSAGTEAGCCVHLHVIEAMLQRVRSVNNDLRETLSSSERMMPESALRESRQRAATHTAPAAPAPQSITINLKDMLTVRVGDGGTKRIERDADGNMTRIVSVPG